MLLSTKSCKCRNIKCYMYICVCVCICLENMWKLYQNVFLFIFNWIINVHIKYILVNIYQVNICATTARSKLGTLTAPKGPPLPHSAFTINNSFLEDLFVEINTTLTFMIITYILFVFLSHVNYFCQFWTLYTWNYTFLISLAPHHGCGVQHFILAVFLCVNEHSTVHLSLLAWMGIRAVSSLGLLHTVVQPPFLWCTCTLHTVYWASLQFKASKCACSSWEVLVILFQPSHPDPLIPALCLFKYLITRLPGLQLLVTFGQREASKSLKGGRYNSWESGCPCLPLCLPTVLGAAALYFFFSSSSHKALETLPSSCHLRPSSGEDIPLSLQWTSILVVPLTLLTPS